MPTALRLVTLVALLAWLAVGDVPVATRLWRAAFNAGHIPLFGVIALLLNGQLERSAPHWSAQRRAVAALAATFLVGLAAEGLQALAPNREASLSDAARNAAGGTAFLVADAYWRARRVWQPATRRLAFSTVLVLLAGASAELARAAAIHVALRQAMPVLVHFDGTWWEDDIVDVGANTLVPSRGSAMSRLSLRPGPYSGVTVDEAQPDWRGYSAMALSFDCRPGDGVQVSIRINDWDHNNDYSDRFNRRVALAPGVNNIRIPLDEVRRAPRTRDMDMSRIRRVIVFVHQLDHPLELGLGPIFLER